MTGADVHLETDVLVIGAGGAGMYAAIEAARHGHDVLLADRALIGRGGMAWGHTFRNYGRNSEPMKREGDKRTPAR